MIFFDKLYSPINGLTYFYLNNNEPNGEKVKFTQIFGTLKHKYSLIATSIKELKCIIEQYYRCFKDSDITSLVLNDMYGAINKHDLIEDQYKKLKILCHGDFHSNNIMVQGVDPIIIDTGGIKYDYWCVDICRLIVHLFITGFDKRSIKYFDVAEIPTYHDIAKKIIALELLVPDGINDGYIYAINWLTQNVEKIYGSYYCKWEFQLGLSKEFLQISYRVNSIPPNKRALALMAAYECMIQANDNLE